MILSQEDQTIIAQCTPQGSGAIALLRLSGSDAIRIADAMGRLASGKKLNALSSHTIHFGHIVDASGHKIDQVMFLLMHGPRTFTGQNTVEITCHNNQALIEQIIGCAIEQGARIAQHGEFTRRAVEHGKIDLMQAEAINELIHAQTELALKKSLAQLEGTLSGTITEIEKELIKALAFSEASFEFIDEEHLEFGDRIKEIIQNTHHIIEQALSSFNQQQHIREGIRIALIGSVNAGKSSLFNALLGKNRAIVTNIAGTTRDSIEAGIYRNGNHCTLVDTAGLRQTDDIIEQEGIKRSFEQAHKADIVLLIFDTAREMLEAEYDVYKQLLNQYQEKVIVVGNKADQPLHSHAHLYNTADVKVSAKDAASLVPLELAMQEKIKQLFKQCDSPFLLSKRQFNLLTGLHHKLTEIAPMLDKPIQYELVSYHLQDALTLLSELTGKSISEQGMDAVFREFCVGK